MNRAEIVAERERDGERSNPQPAQTIPLTITPKEGKSAIPLEKGEQSLPIKE